MTENSVGNGKIVPPKKEHVAIYFIQKEMTALEIDEFYDFYHCKGWLDKSGHLFKNWKTLACEWIWSKKHSLTAKINS